VMLFSQPAFMHRIGLSKGVSAYLCLGLGAVLVPGVGGAAQASPATKIQTSQAQPPNAATREEGGAASDAVVQQADRLAILVAQTDQKLLPLRTEITSLSGSLTKLGRLADANGQMKDLGCVYRGLAADLALAANQGEGANRARLLHALKDASLLAPLVEAKDPKALASPKACTKDAG